jgi:hypothetical protein
MRLTAKVQRELNREKAQYEVFYLPTKNKVGLQVQTKDCNIVIEMTEEAAQKVGYNSIKILSQIRRKNKLISQGF